MIGWDEVVSVRVWGVMAVMDCGVSVEDRNISKECLTIFIL